MPDFAHHHATRVLDCGAMGIVFPHVDNAKTAEKLVSFCLFPPKGHRSMTGLLPQLDFKQSPISEVASVINDNMLIVIMLESPEAIKNVENIAAVPGVDVILIGTNDLCMEMGIPGDYSNPKIKEAYKKVINGKVTSLKNLTVVIKVSNENEMTVDRVAIAKVKNSSQ